jgi:hypothetical protein
MSESFHVNLSYSSGSVVLENNFHWLHLFFHFCDYLLFEEDLTLHLPFTQGWFVPSLMEICQLVLDKKIFFFNINTCKYVFPIVIPPHPPHPGSMIWTNWNLHYVKKNFHVNMSSSGSLVLEDKNFFNDLTKFLHFCDHLPFKDDLALYLYNFEFPLPKDNLYQIWLELACWFWRRIFFFDTNTCKYGFPYCGPSRPPGTMIWTKLNVHYVRKLSCTCKYELFWLNGSWEEDI